MGACTELYSDAQSVPTSRRSFRIELDNFLATLPQSPRMSLPVEEIPLKRWIWSTCPQENCLGSRSPRRNMAQRRKIGSGPTPRKNGNSHHRSFCVKSDRHTVLTTNCWTFRQCQAERSSVRGNRGVACFIRTARLRRLLSTRQPRASKEIDAHDAAAIVNGSCVGTQRDVSFVDMQYDTSTYSCVILSVTRGDVEFYCRHISSQIQVPSGSSFPETFKRPRAGVAIRATQTLPPVLPAVSYGWPCTPVSSFSEEFGLTQPSEGPNINGFLHMTTQTSVFIETLQAFGTTVRWASYNILSAQDHAAAGITKAGTATVFAWTGDWVTSLRSLFHFRQTGVFRKS